MISEQAPRVCGHGQCVGRAVPATWVYIAEKWGKSYYCERHAREHGANLYTPRGTWVHLTPNQRPVSVRE